PPLLRRAHGAQLAVAGAEAAPLAALSVVPTSPERWNDDQISHCRPCSRVARAINARDRRKGRETGALQRQAETLSKPI
ncbi:MAG TPA: hypothetical protein VF534_00045, partial [Paraburkholderia sp.]